jgi:myo-inositol-1(or 4)-monophosphatase
MSSDETGNQRVMPVGARQLAIDLARQAGALLRDRLDVPREVQHKGTIDLVTDADRASETLITTGIRGVFPDHRLVGEEGARGAAENGEGPSPYGWLIDPLDGTTNFAHRYPHFAVSIALEQLGSPILGVVYDPMRDEMFVGEHGEPSLLNDRPITVSDTQVLLASLLATGFPYDLAKRRESNALWQAFNGSAQGVRRDGAAALNLCYVAAGRLDAYWERPVQPWDMAAGVVIVRGAGGIITSLEHDEHDVYSNEVVATNGHLLGEVRGLIRTTLDALMANAAT